MKAGRSLCFVVLIGLLASAPVFAAVEQSDGQVESESNYSRERDLFSVHRLGFGAFIGGSILNSKGVTDSKLKAGVPIGLSAQYRLNPYFGIGADLSYSVHGAGVMDDNTNSSSSSGAYSTSTDPGLNELSFGVNAVAFPFRDGWFGGLKLAYVRDTYGWDQSEWVPEFHTSASSLAWGPVMGFDYLLESGISIGGELSYLVRPDVTFKNQLAGNTLVLPASSDLRILLALKWWL